MLQTCQGGRTRVFILILRENDSIELILEKSLNKSWDNLLVKYKNMIKILKGYWLEIIIGVILIFIDIKIFLFFFFIVYLISSERRTDYLRKLIRTFHITNEVKIVAIMKKFEIDPSDAEEILNEMENSMTEEAINELEKDMASVTNLNNLKN